MIKIKNQYMMQRDSFHLFISPNTYRCFGVLGPGKMEIFLADKIKKKIVYILDTTTYPSKLALDRGKRRDLFKLLILVMPLSSIA